MKSAAPFFSPLTARFLLTDGAKPEETFVTIVDTEGEIHVEHYQIDSLLGHEFQNVFGIGCGEDLLESGIEQVTHRCEDGSVVVDD